MGGGVVERKNTSAGEIDRCELRGGNVDRGWDPPEGHSSSDRAGLKIKGK